VWWSVAKCCSVVMVLVIRCQTSLEDLWTIWSCCLYVFYCYYILSYSLCSIFITVYMVLFLFNNVIYVFLLLRLCILIVCLCMTTLTKVFPCFFLRCKANARVKPAKTGARSALFLIFVLFYVLFVLCYSVYCLCVCVLHYCHQVATQLQSTNITYISYHISYRIVSYHTNNPKFETQ
jgi:hypothetical protein